MIGAIAGDIIGSVYEWERIKTKQFDLFSPRCFFTDDTVLTVALAEAILTESDYGSLMRAYHRRYPGAGYGGLFHQWAQANESKPYNSWGNGAAMRISSVGFAFDTLQEVLVRAAEYTAVTHSHPEGIKGAQATAAAIFLARTGSTKADIRRYIAATFHYDLSRNVDGSRGDCVLPRINGLRRRSSKRNIAWRRQRHAGLHYRRNGTGALWRARGDRGSGYVDP